MKKKNAFKLEKEIKHRALREMDMNNVIPRKLPRKTVSHAKTIRDVTRKRLGTKENSNMAVETRSFERIINLFWCQRYDESAICGMSCLFKHIFPRLVGFEGKENGFGGYRTLK